jgi:CheY-like chemotaxis protein
VEAKPSEAQIIQARVLVVDDDPILRTQIKHLASKFVSEIRIAADGLEGLEIWRQWRPNELDEKGVWH